MYDDFGNNHMDGYTMQSHEYVPKWEKDIDYNPDHQRSTSAIYMEDRGDDVICILQVKGLGVITMRALSSWRNESGKIEFAGVSIFSKSDIGYSPSL